MPKPEHDVERLGKLLSSSLGTRSSGSVPTPIPAGRIRVSIAVSGLRNEPSNELEIPMLSMLVEFERWA